MHAFISHSPTIVSYVALLKLTTIEVTLFKNLYTRISIFRRTCEDKRRGDNEKLESS